MKIQLQEEVDEKERVQHKNIQLENELKTIKKLEKSVQKIDRSKRKLEKEFETYKVSGRRGKDCLCSVLIALFGFFRESLECCMLLIILL